jgi:hypothetical protein
METSNERSDAWQKENFIRRGSSSCMTSLHLLIIKFIKVELLAATISIISSHSIHSNLSCILMKQTGSLSNLNMVQKSHLTYQTKLSQH